VKDQVSIRTSSNAIAIIVLAIGVEIALTILGIHLTSLFAAGGIFALGAGFAAKDIVQNFLSGIALRLDRTISPGDVVQLEDQWLEIETIGVRATVGRTVDDEQILIPNSALAQSTVTNLTREDELVTIRTTIPVDLTSDAELVERVLREAVESLDWVSRNADSAVILSEFTRYSIDFVVGPEQGRDHSGLAGVSSGLTDRVQPTPDQSTRREASASAQRARKCIRPRRLLLHCFCPNPFPAGPSHSCFSPEQ
jgi:small-conductance mechanosensitive channel